MALAPGPAPVAGDTVALGPPGALVAVGAGAGEEDRVARSTPPPTGPATLSAGAGVAAAATATARAGLLARVVTARGRCPEPRAIVMAGAALIATGTLAAVATKPGSAGSTAAARGLAARPTMKKQPNTTTQTEARTISVPMSACPADERRRGRRPAIGRVLMRIGAEVLLQPSSRPAPYGL